MIYRLEIENFYSVRERQIVDLRSRASVASDSDRYAPVFPGSGESVPKVSAIFGANGAGKTTLLRALTFLVWFVRDSFQLRPEAPLPFEPFASQDATSRTTRLAISLGGMTPPESESSVPAFGTYNYELELAHRLNMPSVVIKEVLTHKPAGAKKSSRIFSRDENGHVTGSALFPLRRLGSLTEQIRWNASAISTLAQFAHAQANFVRDAALNTYSNMMLYKQEPTDSQVVALLGDNSVREALNSEISRVDLGATEIILEDGQTGRFVSFRHEGLNRTIPWVLESHGTQAFVRIFPLLWHALSKGSLIILDELDSSLHPHVVAEIVRWFRDPVRNPNNAQLFFTCQNTALLDELVKEEILLCEKDSSGRTSIYSLQDIRNVRRVDNFHRKYLSGAYGAIPNIG